MRKIGYIVIVAAMVTYALAAVFLDFYDDLRMPAGMPGISYFDLLTSPGDGSRVTLTLGAIVTLFGGAFLIAVMCVLVLTRLRDERATRTTVTVAVGVWSTFVIGPALTLSARDFPVGVGFWVQAACAVVAIVGALMLWGGRASEPSDAEASARGPASV